MGAGVRIQANSKHCILLLLYNALPLHYYCYESPPPERTLTSLLSCLHAPSILPTPTQTNSLSPLPALPDSALPRAHHHHAEPPPPPRRREPPQRRRCEQRAASSLASWCCACGGFQAGASAGVCVGRGKDEGEERGDKTHTASISACRLPARASHTSQPSHLSWQ